MDTRVVEELAVFAREHLRSILDMSGEVLYSGAATLKPGQVYLLGHNPGGDAQSRTLKTVRSSLDELPTKTINSYLDTRWNGRAVGASPLQRRVVWLLRALGFEPRTVGASNLIFVRSRDAAASQFDVYADLCWLVHEQILQIVKPQLVVVFGNSNGSPYAYLERKFRAQSHERYPSGHGTWTCRSFLVPGHFRVVGLPHLSRYDVARHPEVAQWIRALAARLPLLQSPLTERPTMPNRHP